MRKVELLPTRDCEAGYGPEPRVVFLSKALYTLTCSYLQTEMGTGLRWEGNKLVAST